MTEATRMIEDLRLAGRLKALPIIRVDKKKMTLYSKCGLELKEYHSSGTWVSTGKLQDGAIRYLGSATHAGHIELKALYVMFEGHWHNIVSGESQPHSAC